MDRNLFIALTGAALNAALAVTIPCLLKMRNESKNNDKDTSFLSELKNVYEVNKKLILASSLIIAITIYLALEFHPNVADAINDLSQMTLNKKLLNLANISPSFSANQLASKYLRRF